MIIHDAVLVDAPIEMVWEVFSEIEHRGEWNPVYRECRGFAAVPGPGRTNITN